MVSEQIWISIGISKFCNNVKGSEFKTSGPFCQLHHTIGFSYEAEQGSAQFWERFSDSTKLSILA